ncbi:hypothetical protein [Pantoea sp. 1.19]|uniref:hypothetical protein n=1 Tax=Pantoea sp. 1.19 TaxID=1925589 RepID=UPI00111528C8|nr:hypothetical protein [Pantoea sp. 1.19]
MAGDSKEWHRNAPPLFTRCIIDRAAKLSGAIGALSDEKNRGRWLFQRLLFPLCEESADNREKVRNRTKVTLLSRGQQWNNEFCAVLVRTRR